MDYVFDDGSTIDQGTGVSTPAPYGMLQQDRIDSAALGGSGGATGSGNFWGPLMQYGIIRAIDNQFGPTPVAGNVGVGSFGGTNGMTYGNTGTNRAGQTIAGTGLTSSNLLMLGLIAAAVYFVAK